MSKLHLRILRGDGVTLQGALRLFGLQPTFRRTNRMRHLKNSKTIIGGSVEPEFTTVRDTFLANFDQGLEVGAAFAVYHHGRLVVEWQSPGTMRQPAAIDPSAWFA